MYMKILLMLILFMILLCYFPKNKESFNTNKKITSYRGNKYDLTSYIPSHPGGSIINKAVNNDLEKIWKIHNVEWHNNNKFVINQLKKMKI